MSDTASSGGPAPDSKIYVAGHRGMVGSAVVRKLHAAGYTNLLTRTRGELDLTRQAEVNAIFAAEQPEYVVLAAARVGGILANNTYRAEFIYQNTMIATNVIHAAWQTGVRKLINLGSSCIYPKHAPQPMKEEHLLTGPLEPTNEPYAMAKITAIKLCRSYAEQYGCNFLSLMPTNLYGPGDNYDPQSSHVLAALVRKFVNAKESGAPEVVVWGDGTPLREFLYVDDLAAAVQFALEKLNATALVNSGLPDLFLNVGSGEEISIADLASLIANVVGYTGRIVYDTTKPNGTPRKLMDSTRMRELGWQAETPLKGGVERVLAAFREEPQKAGVQGGQ